MLSSNFLRLGNRSLLHINRRFLSSSKHSKGLQRNVCNGIVRNGTFGTMDFSSGLGLAQGSLMKGNRRSFLAGDGKRFASTLINALNAEIQEFEEGGDFETVEEILTGSPFQLKPTASADETITLKNGNVLVTFRAAEFEATEDGLAAVPFMAIITEPNSKTQLSFACIARRKEETDEGEVEIEDIAVEPLGGHAKEEAVVPYSPKIGELDEELTASFFEYLVARGVDDDFANRVALIAQVKEEAKYGQWLQEVKQFVQKEDS